MVSLLKYGSMAPFAYTGSFFTPSVGYSPQTIEPYDMPKSAPFILKAPENTTYTSKHAHKSSSRVDVSNRAEQSLDDANPKIAEQDRISTRPPVGLRGGALQDGHRRRAVCVGASCSSARCTRSRRTSQPCDSFSSMRGRGACRSTPPSTRPCFHS